MGHLTAVPGLDAAKTAQRAASDRARVQSIVVGGDLVLTITEDRRIALHELTARGNRELGTFDDVRAAWAVVDRIDLDDNRAQVTTAARTRSTDSLRAA